MKKIKTYGLLPILKGEAFRSLNPFLCKIGSQVSQFSSLYRQSFEKMQEKNKVVATIYF